MSSLKKAENPDQYAKLANEGLMLAYPVKIQGQEHRPDNNIMYHSTIKYFDPQKDHPHAVHNLAQHLPLNPPDAKNTQIGFDTFKDRFGNDVHTIVLSGNSAEKLKEHNGKFAGMGYPSQFAWTPHISVDKATYDTIKASGAKTAHEAGIEFGPAVLKKGPQTLKTYHHEPDSTEPKIPDESDMTAKVTADSGEGLEKSQPEYQFPGLKGKPIPGADPKKGPTKTSIPTRPETNVQPIESKRQRDFSHNVSHENASPIHRDENMNIVRKSEENIKSVIKREPSLLSKHAKALALTGDTFKKYIEDNKELNAFFCTDNEEK